MGKLTFTGPQIDDAIRKVKSGFADVSVVTATPNDVKLGKKFTDKNKLEKVGTLGEASVTPEVTISSSHLTNDESDYYVDITPGGSVISEGIVNSDEEGGAQTKYIQTEERVVTPSGEDQVITPHEGKLISKVTVEAIPEVVDVPIENMAVPTLYFCVTFNPATSSSSNHPMCRFPSGTVFDNIYLKSGVNKESVSVYLIPYSLNDTGSASIYASNYRSILDTYSKKLSDDIIELKCGESITSEHSSVCPSGTLRFDVNGHLIFQITEQFDGLGCQYSGTSGTNCQNLFLIIKNNGLFYFVFVDGDKWSHGYQAVGSKITSKSSLYSECLPTDTRPTPIRDIQLKNFVSPGKIISNFAPVFYSWTCNQDGSSYMLGSLTIKNGTGIYIPYDRKTIDAPVISINSNGVVSWNAIEGARDYHISYSGKSTGNIYNISATSYDLKNKFSSGGEWQIRVRANGTDISSVLSNTVTYSRVLSAPVISKSGNTLSWNAVTNASYYYLFVDGTQTAYITGTSIDLLSYNISAGTHSLTVKAYGSGYTNSNDSNAVSYTVLASPVLSLSDSGMLSWNAVSGASYYALAIDDVFRTNVYSNSVNLTTYINITENHKISVSSKASGGITSKPSTVYTGTPESGDGSSFDEAIIVSYDGNEVTTESYSSDEGSWLYFRIIAQTSGTLYIYSESENDTYGSLYDANQNLIESSDDEYNMSFLFSITVQAGDVYYVECGGYSQQESTFNLVVSPDNPGGGGPPIH